MNGDGAADLLVGAPSYNATGEDTATGAVHIVYGGETDELSGTVSLAEADATLVGAGRGDLAGWSVAAVPNASESGDDGERNNGTGNGDGNDGGEKSGGEGDGNDD
nr:hypothetical protein [Halorussus sp. DT72]